MQSAKIPYRGWNNCHRLANERIECVVTADVGPRVIRFGFIGQENEFTELENDVGKTGGSDWRSYGGHRLWHAPEAMPRTYSPDNDPVDVFELESGLRFVQPVEALSGIQKELEVSLDGNSAHARVLHRLRNQGQWSVELAVWCLTVLGAGGVAIIPLPQRAPHGPDHLVPTSRLALWSYTDLSDSRLLFGKRFILLRHDPGVPEPQKLGLSVPEGWAAYARAGHLFVKKFVFQPEAIYPDMGSSCETWMNHVFIELETLSPLATLAPGEQIEYTEDWYLLEGIAVPTNEEDVIERVFPAIQRLG